MPSPALAPTRITTLLLAVLMCGQAGCNQSTSASGSGKGNGVQDAPRAIYALGRLEPKGGIISIGAIPGERLLKFREGVAEGELVPADGVLGNLSSFQIGKKQLEALKAKKRILDSKHKHQEKLASAQLAQAEAALLQAQAKLKELQLQEKKLGPLGEAAKLAENEHQRLKALQSYDNDIATKHQLEKQANELALAKADHKIASEVGPSAKNAAEQAVKAAEQNQQVAKFTIEQLNERHDLAAVEQEINVAKETLKRSILVAPQAAIDEIDFSDFEFGKTETAVKSGQHTVLKTFVREGDSISQMPVMQVGDLSKMVCIAEVYETDVKNISIGRMATLTSKAFDNEFKSGIKGKVIDIGRMVGSPGIVHRNPLAPADRSVVEVKIEITDKAAVKHAAEFVGLQVKVEFDKDDNNESDDTESKDTSVDSKKASQ